MHVSLAENQSIRHGYQAAMVSIDFVEFEFKNT